MVASSKVRVLPNLVPVLPILVELDLKVQLPLLSLPLSLPLVPLNPEPQFYYCETLPEEEDLRQ